MAEVTKFSCNLEDRPANDATVLRLTGFIDSISYQALKAVLVSWMNGDQITPRKHLVIDCQGVIYCASAGWSVLFRQTSMLREQKRGLVMFNMSDRLAQSLLLLETKSRMIHLAADEVSAFKALTQVATAEPEL
jgi:anti-anti-sigma factor